MEKVIKETKIETIQKEVIYLCDKCRCEIDNPYLFGKQHNYIILDSDLNYPEHGGCATKFELCETCYTLTEELINNFFKIK